MEGRDDGSAPRDTGEVCRPGWRMHERAGTCTNTHLLSVVENDGAGAFDHGENHDGAEFPPHRHGHVGKRWQLMHELQ